MYTQLFFIELPSFLLQQETYSMLFEPFCKSQENYIYFKCNFAKKKMHGNKIRRKYSLMLTMCYGLSGGSMSTC